MRIILGDLIIDLNAEFEEEGGENLILRQPLKLQILFAIYQTEWSPLIKNLLRGPY
jgi:hypothetical protein